MDSYIYLLIAISVICVLSFIGHYLLINWQVNRLRKESARFEQEWREFMQEVDEKVRQTYNDKFQRWVIED